MLDFIKDDGSRIWIDLEEVGCLEEVPEGTRTYMKFGLIFVLRISLGEFKKKYDDYRIKAPRFRK